MKIYKLDDSLLIDNGSKVVQVNEDWDRFINDDDLVKKSTRLSGELPAVENAAELIKAKLEAPIQGQELWASGVTYLRSKVGRQEESVKAGGSDFYERVYEAERPELFFKATRNRVVGPGDQVRIRKDSSWDVPEPELVLMISSSGKIIGYSIGNDMSSRSIEGENPLYLPQAKCYDGCASLGPCIYLSDGPLPPDTRIELQISRDGSPVFNGDVEISQIKRKFEELVGFLYRECSFENGALLMTGTGIVPGNDFTLKSGDTIDITIPQIGTLSNAVA